MPRPIPLTCTATLALSPAEIGDVILDLDRWHEFTGYGPLPGIRSAAFEIPPDPEADSIVGTRIAVVNTDGSTHAEEILAWDPGREIHLRLGSFSAPLSRFATHFDERWAFDAHADGTTTAVRTFELHARRWWGVPVLWLVRPLMKRAVLRSMQPLMAGGPAKG
ncbi:MAG: hypothetical protein DHS20C14_22620 [Phycisphaeraceae bacterium]|nr:MAG: hypothetical protein DHS20C14_22620 [Phycisphaeraceae bacterium]